MNRKRRQVILSRRSNEPARENTFSLRGPRVVLRPLHHEDFEAWRDVRNRSHDWLTKWEPMPLAGYPDLVNDKRAFASRCGSRDREWQLGTSYGFGLFVDDVFAGEVNISNVQRGPFQNAYVGYWIDEPQAGRGYMPEALVLIFRFAFEDLGLHRLQISIVPRNSASRRVVEKLELRNEGIAERYFEINGVWEDHVRYGITYEDWLEHRDMYLERWLGFL